jgi:tricorn protease
MNLMTVIALLLTGTVGSALDSLSEVSDPRTPAVSPDGGTIVFCWRGDLWETGSSGGRMRCLTPGPGRETEPCYSPDGSMLAFTSYRSGEGDVYVMDSGGGPAKRLTYHDGEDLVMGWSPQGDSVLFTSSRELGQGWLYGVSPQGGTPRLFLAVSAKGLDFLQEEPLIERGVTSWWRLHYRGSGSSDIWFRDSGGWTPLVASGMDERWPMVVEGEETVIFVKEGSSGHCNLWTVSYGGEPVQRTFLDRGHVTFPSVSADGSLVAFEYEGGLWVVGTDEWIPRELELSADTDLPVRLQQYTYTGGVTDDYSVSSDGTRIAMTSAGMLFAGELEGASIEEERSLYAGDSIAASPVWQPGEDALLLTLEKMGGVRMMLMRPQPGDSSLLTASLPTARTLSGSAEVVENPVWSPSGRFVSYTDADGVLHRYDVYTGENLRVCSVRGVLHHSWSPDESWLAFSVPIMAHREDIFVVPSRGGEPINVSRHPNDDFQPLWGPDGNRLVYASRTDEGDYFMKQIWLTQTSWEMGRDAREDLLEDTLEHVSIDFDDLHRRTETLCHVRGYYDFYAMSADGKTLYFPAWDLEEAMDLWSVDWTGENLQRQTYSDAHPERIRTTDDGSVFYLAHGSFLRLCSDGGGSTGLSWSVPVSYNVVERQTAKFDQAWRLLRDNFYDQAMHGANWDSIRSEYRPRASVALLNSDFNDVCRRMLGELSASHLGIWGPWEYGGGERTGEIGVVPDYSRISQDGIYVDSVIPGSPADAPDSRILPGDLIRSIDGIQVSSGNNMYRALVQRSGRKTSVEILRNGLPVALSIEPVSGWALYDLLYEEWVRTSADRVHRMTDDRVGYLHVPSMSESSVANFERDLFAEGLDREGMIIDIRGNGGGSTHDQILRQLRRPTYAYSLDRTGNLTTEPLGVWNKPLVLLIDETCFSDAEIFPAAWKELDLGPVVGNTTFGGVIGTRDIELFDGTGFRLPSTGWYTVQGGNLENSGVEPDVRVISLPGELGKGTDRQLERAVEVMLELLRSERAESTLPAS